MRYIKTFEGLRADLIAIDAKFADRKKELELELHNIDKETHALKAKAILSNKEKVSEFAFEILDEYDTTVVYKNKLDIQSRHFNINIEITPDIDFDKLKSIVSRFEKKCLSEQFAMRFNIRYEDGRSTHADTFSDALPKLVDKTARLSILAR
jgi:hypothetical protein